MASRKEQKERLRREREERERAAALAVAKRKRMGYAAAAVLVAAVVLALVAVVALGGGGGSGKGKTSDVGWPSGSIPKRQETDLAAAVKAAGCTLQNPPSQGRGHVTGHVNYKTAPPTSGPHNPVWAHDGAYRTNPPGVEHLVHPLEHGRVIYWFRPNDPPRVIGDLKKLYDEDHALVILTPYVRPMPYEVAATAWTELLGCKTYNDRVPDAFRAFRDQFRLKGPEYIPNAE
jgi:Protein of unknown function (DUF3105)